MISRLLALLLGLGILGTLALLGYGYSGLMTPEVETVTIPVVVDAD